jgi:hypothetical protein
MGTAVHILGCCSNGKTEYGTEHKSVISAYSRK